MLWILFLGFIVLSPGVILTIPNISPAQAVKKGLSYLNNDLATSCIDSGQWAVECAKYKRIFFSGQTSQISVYAHTIVFFLFTLCLPDVSMTNRLYFTIAFLILSPGMFLSIPGMTKQDCAANGVAEGTFFCDAVVTPLAACKNCQSWIMSDFTSWQQVVVHSLVFVFLCFTIEKVERLL